MLVTLIISIVSSSKLSCKCRVDGVTFSRTVQLNLRRFVDRLDCADCDEVFTPSVSFCRSAPGHFGMTEAGSVPDLGISANVLGD